MSKDSLFQDSEHYRSYFMKEGEKEKGNFYSGRDLKVYKMRVYTHS
jgi:hypothetical protein